MNYENIIRQSITNDGFKISKKLLADIAISEIKRGIVLMFQYGNAVFTVDANEAMPEIHVYSAGVGTEAVSCFKSFMRDLWKKTSHKTVYARAKNKKVYRFLESQGWVKLGIDQNGYHSYSMNRSV